MFRIIYMVPRGLWWSFLTVSGMVISRPGEHKAVPSLPKNETIDPIMN